MAAAATQSSLHTSTALLLQYDISQTLQIAQDVLQIEQLQHHIEEVPDQEWVNAMKVRASLFLLLRSTSLRVCLHNKADYTKSLCMLQLNLTSSMLLARGVVDLLLK